MDWEVGSEGLRTAWERSVKGRMGGSWMGEMFEVPLLGTGPNWLGRTWLAGERQTSSSRTNLDSTQGVEGQRLAVFPQRSGIGGHAV